MPQITASRAGRSDGIPIGELSRLTGVNIETIRYYEKIKMLRPPPVPKVAAVSMDQPRPVCSRLSGAAGSLVSVLTRSAPCSRWERRGRRHARMCARSPRTILMISAPRSPTSGSSKGCSQTQSHNVREAGCQIAPS